MVIGTLQITHKSLGPLLYLISWKLDLVQKLDKGTKTVRCNSMFMVLEKNTQNEDECRQ